MEFPLPDVPSDLIVDFDLFNVRPVEEDLHAGWHAFHDGPEIIYSPLNGGHWVLTRAEDIFALYRDDVRLSHRGIALFRDQQGPPRFIPGEIDPPEHSFYRTILNPELSPKRVNAVEQRSRALLVEIIEKLQPAGGCEFYAAVAKRMPIYNFLSFMQLPIEDAETLLPSSEVIGRDSDVAAFEKALGEVLGYIDQRILERQAVPTDDFIGHLIAAEVNGRKLSFEEMRVTILNVLLGGLDTVSASMGFFMNFLARNPEHRRQLVEDPELIGDAVEELLRRHAIFSTGRLVNEGFEYKGIYFRKNDLVLFPSAMFNLDERRFPDPLAVDFRREDKNHLTFGIGVHRCLGSTFARLQLKLLLREWLARIPEFRVAPGERIVAQSGRANSVLYLPLVW